MYKFGDVVICKNIYTHKKYCDPKSRPYLVLSTSITPDGSTRLKCLKITSKTEQLCLNNNLLLSSVISSNKLSMVVCNNIISIPESEVINFAGHINDSDKNNVIKKLIGYYECTPNIKNKELAKCQLDEINKQYIPMDTQNETNGYCQTIMENLPKSLRPNRRYIKKDNKKLKYTEEENM